MILCRFTHTHSLQRDMADFCANPGIEAGFGNDNSRNYSCGPCHLLAAVVEDAIAQAAWSHH